MTQSRPTYEQLEERLAAAEPIIEALKRHEVDAVVGREKIGFLLLRKVEEAWLQSNGEFDAMFDLGGIGMIQADGPAFRFTRVNPKFCEMTGYSEEELLTKTYIGLTDPQDRKEDLNAIARVIRNQTDSWTIEKRCLHRDGRTIWLKVHGIALRDLAGPAIRILAMIEDVTVRKQDEQRPHQTQGQLNKQLRAQTAALSKIRRSIRTQASGRKSADQVLKAIQDFLDRTLGPIEEKPTAGRRKPSPQKKAPAKGTRKSAVRKSSGKPRRTAR